jgi:hypothetical protein
MSSFFRVASALISTTFAVLVASAAPAIDITSCGVIVGPREVGVLQADLQCQAPGLETGYGRYGIVLAAGAVLDLNGHALDHSNTSLTGGVFCRARCEVRGPGTITSSGLGNGVATSGHGRVSITDVDFEGQHTGVAVPFGKVTLTNVNIAASTWGVAGQRVFVDDVSITLTAANPASCVDVYNYLGGTSLTLSGCRLGIFYARRVDLVGLTVTNSIFMGLVARHVALQDSTVTGSNGSMGPDIGSTTRPRLVNTVCDHSAHLIDHLPTSESWGVCAGD